MGNPVVHWEIAAKDAAKQQDFYRKLFDWNIQVDNTMNYGVVRTGGTGGIDDGIFAPPNSDWKGVTFYIAVDDLQAYLDKAGSMGGKTVLPPMPIPGVGSIAQFIDPERNCIGLFKGQ
jgi:predicted enzyme related to lactoylglutathione lyase